MQFLTRFRRLALVAVAVAPLAFLVACEDPGDMPPPEGEPQQQDF